MSFTLKRRAEFNGQDNDWMAYHGCHSGSGCRNRQLDCSSPKNTGISEKGGNFPPLHHKGETWI